ncbi:MAG: hypothetical protein ACKOAL_12695 [Chthoniobacterales bacterium]
MDKTALIRLFLAIAALPLLPGCAAPAAVARSGDKPVMIYDTQTGRMVSDEVYNLREQ